MSKLQYSLDRFYGSIDRRLGGYITLLVRTGLKFDQDDGAVMSRSIAYYALFSIFPLLLILMSFTSAILETEEVFAVVLDFVGTYLPGADDLVSTNIDQVLSARDTVRILALLSLLWSASGVFTAMYRAVNRAWGNPKSELFWTEKLYGLAVVFVVGLLLVASTFFGTFASVVRSWQVPGLDWQPFAEAGTGVLWGWLSKFLPAFVSVATFTTLYRTIPRNRVRWRDVWAGGLVAGLAFELARQLFTWYLANFARYGIIYGSVGAIIAFLLWAYIGSMILLAGAEFTAEHTSWRHAGRPTETRALSELIEE
ncbi:YihY/virulence factor BrkB family protein [Chloroflexota bacterium]